MKKWFIGIAIVAGVAGLAGWGLLLRSREGMDSLQRVRHPFRGHAEGGRSRTRLGGSRVRTGGLKNYPISSNKSRWFSSLEATPDRRFEPVWPKSKS